MRTMAAQIHAHKPSTTGRTFALAQVPGKLDTLQKEGSPDLGKEILRDRKERTAASLNAGPSRLKGTCPRLLQQHLDTNSRSLRYSSRNGG